MAGPNRRPGAAPLRAGAAGGWSSDARDRRPPALLLHPAGFLELPLGVLFFEELCGIGGRVGSAEYDRFGFQQQMVSAVSALVDANLVVREVDPDNGSRTVNAITALGWLVFFYRTNFEMPPPRAVPTPSA